MCSLDSSVRCRRQNLASDSFAQDLRPALPRLKRYALTLTRYTAAADDLVQETVLRGIEKIRLWQPGTDLRAWLFTLLRNGYINGVRRAKREAVILKMAGSEASSACPPTQTEWLEVRDLQRGLAKLPKNQRSVVVLIGLEGTRYATAASVLGIPIGTVRSRFSGGRANLRACAEEGPESRARRRPARNRGAA